MIKKLVGVGVIAVIGAAVGAMLGYGPLLRYKAEGMLSMEMGAAEYKRFAELADDSETIRQFAAVSPPPDSDSGEIHHLISQVAKGTWHKPVPKVSKADAKELPDLLQQLEQQHKPKQAFVYLGLKLSHTASEAREAANMTEWLGSYFRDAAAREGVREQVSRWKAENRQFLEPALVSKLRHEFDIEQAQIRAQALRKIVASYPDAVRGESRQVINISKDNEKFISPLAQLVGAESEIIENREKLLNLKRYIEQQAFAKELIDEAEVAVSQARSGRESIAKLSVVVSAFSKKTKTDAEREKLLSMTADIGGISSRFMTQAQFVAKPSIPSRPERPGPLMVTVLFAALFAMLGAGYFWRNSIVKLLQSDN